MNKVFYTNLLLKKDIQIYNARINNEGSTEYPLLKNDVVEEILQEKNIVKLLDTYGIVSLTLSDQWDMQVVSDKLLNSLKQLTEVLALKDVGVGAGKLHIVISEDIKEEATFKQVDQEMVIAFNHPDNLDKFAKQWFHFVDKLQTIGKSPLPQSEIEDKSSSIQQLINIFEKVPNSIEEKNTKKSYKQYCDELSIVEGLNYNSRSEMASRGFESYIQSQLDKENKISLITNKKQQQSSLYPSPELQQEQVDLWRMILNKYQKKLQPDRSREIVRIRMKTMKDRPTLRGGYTY